MAMKAEAASSSETSVTHYPSTRRYIPQYFKSTFRKPQITPTRPPMVPIPKQINLDHTLNSTYLRSLASQWALKLAPVARKATSSHPPFFFWDVRRLVRPTGLLGHSVMSCPASIYLWRVLAPIPFAVWNSLSSLSKIHFDNSLLPCLG